MARPPRPTPAESRLLALARVLTESARQAKPADTEVLRQAIRTLSDAYRPDASLPQEVCRAWLRSRGDKNASLALSWAREQVRLGLEETLARAGSPRVIRALLRTDVLAWLLLAGCEAIAHEPPSAIGDRLHALLELGGTDRSA